MYIVKTFADANALAAYLNATPGNEKIQQIDLSKNIALVNRDDTPQPPDSEIIISCVSEHDPKKKMTKTTTTYKDGHKVVKETPDASAAQVTP